MGVLAPAGTAVATARAPVTQREPLSVLQERNSDHRNIVEGYSSNATAKGSLRPQVHCGTAAPPRPPPKEFIVPSTARTGSKRRDVVLDDDVRMEDLLKMRAQMAAPASAAHQFGCKENVRP